MFYFSVKDRFQQEKPNFLVPRGLPLFYLPKVGNVLKVFFSKKGSAFFFEGLCFKTKFKHFGLPDAAFSIANKVKGSSILFTFSFFYNMVFSIEFAFLKKSNRFFERPSSFIVLGNANFLFKLCRWFL